MKTWIPSAAASVVISAAFFLFLNQSIQFSALQRMLIVPYLLVVFSIVIYVLIFRLALPRFLPQSSLWKTVFLAGCLLAGLWLAHNIPVRYPLSAEGGSLPSVLKAIFLLGTGLGLGLILYFTSTLLATSSFWPRGVRVAKRWRWVVFSLPILIIWGVYLLAFWPGMMSADSLVQWEQVLTGQFNNHHPAFHTFTIWLATRLFISPAMVAVFQILGLALVTGWILATFEKQGIPSFLLWFACLLFALSPVNGTMVNTLWKDIPYSTAVLGLTFLVYRLVSSRGAWITARGSWVVFGITAALVMLFRHNGWPVVLGTLLLILVVYRRSWQTLLLSAALAFGLFFGITGPIYDLVGVKDSTVLIESTTSLYSVASRSTPGTETGQILARFQPFSKNWLCTDVSRFPELSQNLPSYDSTGLGNTIVNLARYAPNLALYQYRCNRSLIWIISDPDGQVRNTSHVELLIDPNPFGLEPDSKLPALREEITDLVVSTAHDPNINWLIWRPALYLYLFLWVMAVQAVKQKNGWILLTAAPILIQSVTSSMITLLPNFRYHYAAILIAMVFWPVFFMERPADGPIAPSDDSAAGSVPVQSVLSGELHGESTQS